MTKEAWQFFVWFLKMVEKSHNEEILYQSSRPSIVTADLVEKINNEW